MKLNVGSHNKRLKGYTNIDALDLENVDIVHNLTMFPWPIEDNSVEDIVSQEFLEHVSFRVANPILRECFRILKHGSNITIQVPDIGLMCKYYVEDLICDCVPRKAMQMADYKADENCQSCNGKALIHPERWSFAFTGAQKHEYDAHLNVFTKEHMRVHLRNAGFTNIRFIKNIYKIVVRATKAKVL